MNGKRVAGIFWRFVSTICMVGAVALITGCGPGADANSGTGGSELIGHIGRQPGQFSKPRAVAITEAGEIVVIDRTGRVQFYDVESREFLRQWRLPAHENGTPTGISVDPMDDSLWIADTHYYRILQFDKHGNLLSKFGEEGEGPGEFVFPTDVAPDPDGQTLWVTEYGRRNRIMQFTREGEFIKEWGSKLHESADLERPMAIAVSPGGKSLYVVDAGNHRVNIYDREGNLKSRFGEIGREPGQMKFPLDLAVAPEGTLYLVEYENGRISHYTAQGEFLGWWGGPGREPGQLHFPWGCAVGPEGRLVIADTENQRLQLIENPARYFRQESYSVAQNGSRE